MSRSQDDRTDPDAPVVDVPKGVVAGESTPPDEHTMRVRTKREQAPSSTLNVHDDRTPGPEQPSSTELADVSRRRQRRQRDQKAERRALMTVLAVFLGVGGALLAGVNLFIDDPPPSDQVPVEPPKKAQLSGVYSSTIDETPAIPAFESLRNEGLTIVAEGLPQVDLVGEAGAAALAALETCRFAYAVWEFSPNKRFRFMSTCEALDGQVMVGAYEIRGSIVKMSPLISDTDAVTSEFRVEHPSRMVSVVSRRPGEEPVLEISQKVTAIRPGLDGEAWRDAFSAKNTIRLPTGRPPESPKEGRPPPPPPPAKGKDPLLELLQK